MWVPGRILTSPQLLVLYLLALGLHHRHVALDEVPPGGPLSLPL